jgi:hypothetical protein
LIRSWRIIRVGIRGDLWKIRVKKVGHLRRRIAIGGILGISLARALRKEIPPLSLALAFNRNKVLWILHLHLLILVFFAFLGFSTLLGCLIYRFLTHSPLRRILPIFSSFLLI